MMNWRAITVSVSFFCALTACHQSKIVHIDVFEDYVSIEGVRSNLSIQQAADAEAHDHKGYVLLVPRPPLSKARLDELKRSMDQLYPGVDNTRPIQPTGGAGN
jgi:hypothetical protein